MDASAYVTLRDWGRRPFMR